MHTRKTIAIVICTWALTIIFAASYAQAILYQIDKDPQHVLYGNLNQNAIPNGGQFMCGPTAVVNSLVYLQNQYPNHYGNSLIGDADGDGNPNTNLDLITVAQTLASPAFMNTKNNPQVGSTGTWSDMLIWGKQQYIEQQIPNKTVYAAQLNAAWAWAGRPADETPPLPKPAWVQQNTIPTWNFMWNQLQSCEDVELLINWTESDEAKGHYLTIKSFLWNDANNNGMIEQAEGATIDYIDPATGAVGNSFIMQFAPGGVLDVIYGGKMTQVTMIVSESTPEPATLSLLALGGLAALRRRRG